MTNHARRLAAALALLLGACAPAPARSAGSHDSSVIRAEEIENAHATNAYLLVQSVRPQWLQRARPQTLSGNDGIRVYMGNVRLGGLEALRQISVSDVMRLEFLSPAAAQLRLGAGNLNGAIVVTAAR